MTEPRQYIVDLADGRRLILRSGTTQLRDDDTIEIVPTEGHHWELLSQ